MANDNTAAVDTEHNEAQALTAEPAVKKTRGAGRKTAKPQVAAETVAPAKRSRAKRVAKVAAPMHSESTAAVEPLPEIVDDQAVPLASAASDEFSDLLQLEKENKRLRKLWGDKLRAENADLLKRLNAK